VTAGGRFWPVSELRAKSLEPLGCSVNRLEAVLSLSQGLRATFDPDRILTFSKLE
jgi:hypothetical protein